MVLLKFIVIFSSLFKLFHTWNIMTKNTLLLSIASLAFSVLLSPAFAGKGADGDTLKQGGYVIYMRHPHTDKSKKDTDKKNLENCATQRNLSDKGRQVARDIGAAIKKLSVSFKQIYEFTA